MLGYATAQQTPAASSPQSATAAPKTAAKKPATASKPAPAVTLKTQREKNSYALGMSIGLGLHKQGIDVDPALVARGVRDQMGGAKTLISEDEMRATLQQLRGDLVKQQEAKAREAGAAKTEVQGHARVGRGWLVGTCKRCIRQRTRGNIDAK